MLLAAASNLQSVGSAVAAGGCDPGIVVMREQGIATDDRVNGVVGHIDPPDFEYRP